MAQVSAGQVLTVFNEVKRAQQGQIRNLNAYYVVHALASAITPQPQALRAACQTG